MVTESIDPAFKIGMILLPLPLPKTFNWGGELYSVPPFNTITSDNLPPSTMGNNWAFLPFFKVNNGCLL